MAVGAESVPKKQGVDMGHKVLKWYCSGVFTVLNAGFVSVLKQYFLNVLYLYP